MITWGRPRPPQLTLKVETKCLPKRLRRSGSVGLVVRLALAIPLLAQARTTATRRRITMRRQGYTGVPWVLKLAVLAWLGYAMLWILA